MGISMTGSNQTVVGEKVESLEESPSKLLLSLCDIEEYLETEGNVSEKVKPNDSSKKEDTIPIAHEWGKKERSLDVQMVGKDAKIRFEDLQLKEKTLMGLAKCGFYQPSPIQLKAIPFGKFGYDLVLQSKSGTGKTCAFGLIILEQMDLINAVDQVQALLIAPTREIACQNADVIKGIGCYMEGLRVKVFIGGTSVDQSIRRSKVCNVASGTPGRIWHMISDGEMDVSKVQIVVLDEADKLLESLYMEDLTAILDALPKTKQVIAASATYTDGLKEFLKRFMCEPMEIASDPSQALLAIHLCAVDVYKVLDKPKDAHNQEAIFTSKMEVLLKILEHLPFTQAIVFSRSFIVDKIYDVLLDRNYDTGRLTGALAQFDRLTALRNTQRGKCRILVASDLGARGIDCEGVDLVINFEPPDDAFTFVHRFGRAGRFGSSGTCITLATYRGDFRTLSEFAKISRFETRVIISEQQIVALGKGQHQKLESLRRQHAKVPLSDLESDDVKEKLDLFMNLPTEYPSVDYDIIAGFKLNVDVSSVWNKMQEMKRKYDNYK